MNKSVEAVILDWAGTVVDFGSFPPHKFLSMPLLKPLTLK